MARKKKQPVFTLEQKQAADVQIKESQKPQQSASINSSQTTEINPYLLLMAHTIIKQVLDIDNNKTLGIESHIDKH